MVEISDAKVARSTPAVTRAFAILGLIRRDGPLTVRDVAARLGLPRSSVHELVHTLATLGAIAPADGGGGRFTLGLLLHELGSAYLSEVDVAREGQRAAESVAAACGETVHLAILDGIEVVYLAKVDSIHAVRMVSAVGRRLPAQCTGVGKAMLSALSDEEVERRFGGDDRLEAMTPNSITTLRDLVEALAEVRRVGYSIDNCESNRDVRCVAAPVHDHRGATVAAMSISVPVIRTAEDWPGHLVELVRDGARELSRRLGRESNENI
jgi:IclR family transcriptional regulator, KDG regulon repressor